MQNPDAQRQWEEYRERELRTVTPRLQKLGFMLDGRQVHTAGERYLMAGERDVGGGGYKLVLLGRRAKDSKRVIIKVSSNPKGISEIETERQSRETLRILKFAYQTLRAPEEILYTKEGRYRIFITAYIEQEQNFLNRPLENQFSLALHAFKAQESVYATTYSHTKAIRNSFGIWGSGEYFNSFDLLSKAAIQNDPENMALKKSLGGARAFLVEHRDTLEQYCGFLTHADFVPHNFRVHKDELYLLDSASLHFGNKYESWARFLNFMLLYNRPLEDAFLRYIHDNRTPEEALSLTLMRLYKLGKLLEYHTGTLSKTTGDLHILGKKRVVFWHAVLDSLLDERPLPQEIITRYQHERESLRSEEEKKRQEALH